MYRDRQYIILEPSNNIRGNCGRPSEASEEEGLDSRLAPVHYGTPWVQAENFNLGCVVSYGDKTLPSQHIENMGIFCTLVNCYYYSHRYCVVKEFSTDMC